MARYFTVQGSLKRKKEGKHFSCSGKLAKKKKDSKKKKDK